MYIFKEQAVVISNLHSSKAYTAYQTNPIEPYTHQQVFKPFTFMIISQHKNLISLAIHQRNSTNKQILLAEN